MNDKITISYEFTLDKDELQEERGEEYTEDLFQELTDALQEMDEEEYLVLIKELVKDIHLDELDIENGVEERADYSIESQKDETGDNL